MHRLGKFAPVFQRSHQKTECAREAADDLFNAIASFLQLREGVENRKAGAGVRATCDRPLSNLNLWSIKTVLAVEPFITMSIEPGSEFTWKITYDYYTLPSDAK